MTNQSAEKLLSTNIRALLGWLVLVAASAATSGAMLGQDLSPQSRPRDFERPVFDLDRFSEQSDVIVRGVVSTKQARWVGQVIYTHYDLVVLETIHGQASAAVTVAVLGGAIGNVQLAVPGAPELAVGDEIVFFGQSFEGQSSFRPVGLGSGVVPITRGSGAVAWTVAPRGRREILDEFLNEVRSKSRPE